MIEEEVLRTHADHATRAYDRVRPDYQRCATKVQQMMTAWLDDASINYESVSARAKTRSSFRRKSSRAHPKDPGRPKYGDPLAEITDLVGARVITYLPESVDRTCEIVQNEFEVIEHQDKGQITKGRGLFGYASKHFLVRLDPARAALAEYKVLKNKVVEIQVRTAAQHAWAEFEHDVRYKVGLS